MYQCPNRCKRRKPSQSNRFAHPSDSTTYNMSRLLLICQKECKNLKVHWTGQHQGYADTVQNETVLMK